MYKKIENQLKKHAKITLLTIVFVSIILIASNVTGVSDIPSGPASQSSKMKFSFEKDLDNPARQPIQSDTVLQTPDVTKDITGTLFHVPLKKRLVIEFVSAEVSLLQNEKFTFHIQTKLNGSISNHFMTPNLIGIKFEDNNDTFAISQQTRLYADPGTDVLIQFHKNAGGGEAKIETSISGYLVDI